MTPALVQETMEAHILEEGRVVRADDLAAIRAAHAARKPLWVEIGQASPEVERFLVDTFGVHPLVVEDIFGERSAPKIEAFDDYLYVVVHALTQVDDPLRADLALLDIVLGDTFVLTQHREGPARARLREKLEAHPQLLAKGPTWVAHAFIDGIVDRYSPFMDRLGQRVDQIEEQVVHRVGTSQGLDLLPELFALRRSIQTICRIAHHQQELLERLSRRERRQIPADAQPYFRDVYDHFARITDRADQYRDAIASATDAYMNVQSNRMNDTVKRLTLISTVLLPLNFIASFYGMNFRFMPEYDWRWGRELAVGLMIAVGIGVLGWFKKKRWI